MLENTSPYFGLVSHGCFFMNSSKVRAPSMKGTGGGAGGSRGVFRVPGMRGAGEGAGGSEGAFRAPGMRGTGGGAGGGSFTAEADKEASSRPGAGLCSRVRDRALKSLKASEMRAPLWEPNMTEGGAGDTREAFRAPEMKGSGGGAGTRGAFTAPGIKGTEDGDCGDGNQKLGPGANCKSQNPLNRCGARWRQGSLKQPQSSLDKSEAFNKPGEGAGVGIGSETAEAMGGTGQGASGARESFTAPSKRGTGGGATEAKEAFMA